jgi:hypothetical protein
MTPYTDLDMIKLLDILKEIGDASSQPYKFEFYGSPYDEERYYGFETSHYPYSVHITNYEDNEIEISFFVPNEKDPDQERYDIETNRGDLFKIMATVVAIVKQDLKTHPEVDTLIFTPVKKQGAIDNSSRANLYLRYVKHSYPGAKVESNGDEIIVKIK